VNQNRNLRMTLGLIVAIGLLGARTEKIWTEVLGHLDLAPSHLSQSKQGHEPFDPRRVPQSGGMASRLLAGIKVRLI
jgi:hypothetical protein